MLHRRFFTAFISAALLCSTASCGRIKNEEISDSQEQNSSESDIQPTESSELSIAVLNESNAAADIITAFASQHPNIRVDLRDYQQIYLRTHDADNMTFDDLFSLLKLDMFNGDCPDVMILPPSYMMRLQNGYLADLYPLIDAETSTVHREDFCPNILSGLETDGKLFCMAYGYNIYTAAARTSAVGEDMENWTPAEAAAVYDSVPDGKFFLHLEYCKDDFPRFFIEKIQRDCIDMNNLTCDYHGSFLDAFDVINRHYSSFTELADYKSMPDYDTRQFDVLNGDALVNKIWLNGINYIAADSTYRDFGGEDITFVGYPSESGCGAITDCPELMGICETSPNTDTAWEFISSALDADYQCENTVNGGGLPVIDAAIDAAMEYSEWNRQSINTEIIMPGNTGETAFITDSMKECLADYIRSIDFQPLFDNTLLPIINMESYTVLCGKQSPETAADNLESRLSLYLSEHTN